MKEFDLSWDDFKTEISNHIKKGLGPRMYRGQSDSEWQLMTSFHRQKTKLDFNAYFTIIQNLAP